MFFLRLILRVQYSELGCFQAGHALGVSIAQGVVTTYIIIDAGVTMGAPVRAAINITAGLAGVVIPKLVEKWGDKHVVRGLMALAALAVPCVLAKTMVTLLFAGLALGMAQVGISLILMRPNTGSSASTHEVTNASVQAFSALAWGGVRQLVPPMSCFCPFW